MISFPSDLRMGIPEGSLRLALMYCQTETFSYAGFGVLTNVLKIVNEILLSFSHFIVTDQ